MILPASAGQSFSAVAAKVCFAHVVIRADHAALENGEEVFGGVAVLEATSGHIFLGAVGLVCCHISWAIVRWRNGNLRELCDLCANQFLRNLCSSATSARNTAAVPNTVAPDLIRGEAFLATPASCAGGKESSLTPGQVRGDGWGGGGTAPRSTISASASSMASNMLIVTRLLRSSPALACSLKRVVRVSFPSFGTLRE